MPYLVHGGAEAFKRDTMKKVAGIGKLKIRVSGKNLAPVIAALQHYESVSNSMNPTERQAALCTVISKCRKWLDLKQAKINAAQDPDATVKLREQRVTSLMNEAWAALIATDGGATAHAFGAYDARRQGGRRQAQGMAPGYTTERAAYVASGKGRSVSGSLIDDLLDKGRTRNQHLPPTGPAGSPAKAHRDAVIQQNHQLRDRLKQGVQNRTLASLTVADWQKIDKIASTAVEGLETRYMPRGQRLRYLLESDGAGGLRYAAGQRSAATVGSHEWPYAMDEWGNLYTADDQLPVNRTGYAMFNHSTFTAGDDVVCAGMLQIDPQGKLLRIDTNSGHYKPTKAQLQEVVRILRDEYHVDTDGTEIHVVGVDAGGMPTRTIWGVGEAVNFLADLPPLPPVPTRPLPPIPG